MFIYDQANRKKKKPLSIAQQVESPPDYLIFLNWFCGFVSSLSIF